MLWTLFVIFLVFAIVSHTPYGAGWGTYPGPIMWILCVVLLIYLLVGLRP